MPNLGVTESESVSLKVLSKGSPTSCSHLEIVVSDDGVETTYYLGEAELAEPVTQRELVLAWLRYRQAKGKTHVNVRIV